MKRLLEALLAGLCALAAAGCAGPPGAEPFPAPASSAAATAPAADDTPRSWMSAGSERYIVLAVANQPGRLSNRAGSTLLGYSSPPRYVVGSQAAATVSALARDYSLREAASWPIPQLSLHCVVLEVAPGASRDAVLARLARDERVQLAQPLQEFEVLGGEPAPHGGGVRYNDPYVKLQHGFAGTGAPRAHLSSLGAGVQVAVVDTGADTAHPDLLGRVQAVHNFVDGDAAAFNQDRHGTEVAGVISAVGNNAEGIVGMAPGARLSLFKACWYPVKAEAGARCNSFTLAKALAAVIDSNAQVVNLSLGGPADGLLDRLLGQLLKQGRAVVAALPPDGRRGGFPTGTPGVIAVGVDSAQAPPQPDVITAPGRDVLTLRPGGRYDFAQGSSIAAAHVSGAMALLLAMPSGMEPLALAELLRNGGKERGDPASRLSVDTAVEALSTRQRQSAKR